MASINALFYGCVMQLFRHPQLLQLGLTVDTPIPSRAANTANPQKVAVLGKTCIIRVVDDYLVMSTDR